jgi:hypothetical protein
MQVDLARETTCFTIWSNLMKTSPTRQSITIALLASSALAACSTDSAGLTSNPAPDGSAALDVIAVSASLPPGSVSDAGRASVTPILRVGVDPSIFLPVVVAGYHPTAEELATSGKACSSLADCATSGGQVVFHCSTPYYGQAQCQGVFPAGDQTVPGVAPSCAYYECPAGYQCETEAETHSVTCLAGQSGQNGKPTSAQDGGQSGKPGGKSGGGGGGA